MISDEERLAALREEHPGWVFWRSRSETTGEPNCWCATRREEVPEHWAGVYDLSRTLIGDTADHLDALLGRERVLERRLRGRPAEGDRTARM